MTSDYEREILADYDLAQECGMTIGDVRRWWADRRRRERATMDSLLTTAQAAHLKALRQQDSLLTGE